MKDKATENKTGISNWIDERGALRPLTHLHGVDGMFAAKLKRKQ